MDLNQIGLKIIAFLSSLSGPQAYAAILGFLFICGLGFPLPEDITLIAAGILAALGKVSLEGAIIASFVGVLVGDCLLYSIGRKYGRRVFSIPLFSQIFTEKRVAQAEARIHRNARIICFTARFLPGLRAPIYLTAGVLRVKLGIFLFQDGLAALLSVPVWVYLGYWFGNNIEDALRLAKEIQIGIFVALGLVLVLYIVRKRRSRYLPRKNAAPPSNAAPP